MSNKRKQKNHFSLQIDKKKFKPTEEEPTKSVIKIEEDIFTIEEIKEEDDRSASEFTIEEMYSSILTDHGQDIEDHISDEEVEQEIETEHFASTDEKDPLALIDYEGDIGNENEQESYQRIIYTLESDQSVSNDETKMISTQQNSSDKSPNEQPLRFVSPPPLVVNINRLYAKNSTPPTTDCLPLTMQSSTVQDLLYYQSSDIKDHIPTSTVPQPIMNTSLGLTSNSDIAYTTSVGKSSNQIQLITPGKDNRQLIPIQTSAGVIFVQPTSNQLNIQNPTVTKSVITTAANPSSSNVIQMAAKVVDTTTQSKLSGFQLSSINSMNQITNNANFLSSLQQVHIPFQNPVPLQSLNSTNILSNLLRQPQPNRPANNLIQVNTQSPNEDNTKYVVILSPNQSSQPQSPAINIPITVPGQKQLSVETVIHALATNKANENSSLIQIPTSFWNSQPVNVSSNNPTSATMPTLQTSNILVAAQGQTFVTQTLGSSNNATPNNRCCIFDDLLKMKLLPALWTDEDKVQLILEGKPQKMGFLKSSRNAYCKFEWMTGCITQEAVLCWPCLLFAKQVWNMKLNAKAEDAAAHEITLEHRNSSRVFNKSRKEIMKNFGDNHLLRLKIRQRKLRSGHPTSKDSTIIESLLHNPFRQRSEYEKRQILAHGKPCPPLSSETVEGSFFDRDLYEEVEWLTASKELNKFYCWPCLLYADQSIWSMIGYSNVTTLPAAIFLHESTKSHIRAAQNFSKLPAINSVHLLHANR